MTIKTIQYSQSRETYTGIGLKQWNKCGFEAEIEPGENPLEQLDELKKIATKFHENPTQVTIAEALQGVLPEVQVDKTPKEARIEVLIEEIEKEMVLRKPDGTGGLLSWEKLANSNPSLKPAFDKRLKELS